MNSDLRSQLRSPVDLRDLYAESGQTLQGSFSAVSKQILEQNMRWKALAEIYTMQSFAQLCNLIFLPKFCQNDAQALTSRASPPGGSTASRAFAASWRAKFVAPGAFDGSTTSASNWRSCALIRSDLCSF